MFAILQFRYALRFGSLGHDLVSRVDIPVQLPHKQAPVHLLVPYKLDHAYERLEQRRIPLNARENVRQLQGGVLQQRLL